MTLDLSDGFSRLEFKRSLLPYRALAFIGSLGLPLIVMKATTAMAPGLSPAHPVVVPVTWCFTAAGCLLVFSRLIARADLQHPIVIVDPEGVTISDFVTKTWPWASVSKIKFYETGRFKENKSVVFHLVAGGSEGANLRPVVGTKGRQLFETMRAYHRKFGPQPDPLKGGPSYDSALWTGLDDG